ncbi:MAG: hypothetical protein LW884_04245, partial [Bacteroidetes bacterium]|nr:hypothetical protein [Bacteroidota bacterium]
MKAINSIPVLALAALLALVSYPGQAKADVAGGCYETQRIWKEGYWRVSSRGQVWIPGRWISRQVAVPCPPPVYPAPGGRPVVVRPHDYPPAAPAPSMGPQEYQAVLAQLS